MKSMTMAQLRGELKRTQYVWEMNRFKTRTTDATKARLEREFEDAVLALAARIKEQRKWETGDRVHGPI